MRLLPVGIALTALAVSALACSRGEVAVPPPVAAPEPPPPPPALEPAREFEVRSGRIERNETIVGALGRIGVEVVKTHEIVAALDGLFDFRKARPGDEFRVTRLDDGTLEQFEYRRGPVEEYVVRLEEDGKLRAEAREFLVETQVVQVVGTLQSSLYEAIAAGGEDPQLAVAMADVLAWDVDFYNDPRKGDSFRILVEKNVHDGQRIGYGNILAAEYNGSLVGRKRIFRYENPRSGHPEYYGEDGSAARRAFLKSPLKFANITSKFGSRFHPVLKYVRNHEGVDFGAPTGTPVWAVGDGVVTRSGWGGGCGNMVALRHANGLESVYCHFSRIASGIRVGKRVSQKEVIGFVGATGYATGPHLHYAIKRGGRYINPLTLKFPPADPIPADQREEFFAAIEPLTELLGGGQYASAASPEAEAVAQ